MKFKSCKLSMIDKLRYWFLDLWYNRVTPIFKKSSFETWAEKEVKLAIDAERKASGVKKGWDYGRACYRSALRALKSLEKDNHSGFSIQLTKSILNRMIDWKPLTPIEDTPDGWNYSYMNSKTGRACYRSALRALKSLEKDNHSGFSIQMTKSILNRMIDWKPLTPIEDTPDGWNYSYMNSKTRETVWQNKRMSSLFKHVRQDFGITYKDNNHSVCVDINNKSRYHSGLISAIIDEMYPITMPYMPSDKPIEVYCTDLLTDRKNGDFDTVGIFYCIKPNGERVEINRYFREGSSSNTDLDEWTKDWTEIDEDEWYSRIGLDMKRKLDEEKNRDISLEDGRPIYETIGRLMSEQEAGSRIITRRDLEALEIAQTCFKQLAVEDDLYK